jgi:hypothetical protein
MLSDDAVSVIFRKHQATQNSARSVHLIIIFRESLSPQPRAMAFETSISSPLQQSRGRTEEDIVENTPSQPCH